LFYRDKPRIWTEFIKGKKRKDKKAQRQKKKKGKGCCLLYNEKTEGQLKNC